MPSACSGLTAVAALALDLLPSLRATLNNSTEYSCMVSEHLPVILTLEVGTSSYQMVLPHASVDYIQKKLVADRQPYEREMLEDLKQRVGRGGLVIDIGANIGNHTLFLGAVAGCQVEAFEPNPELCTALRESIRLNGLEGQLKLHEAGLAKVAGRARFGVTLPDNLGGQSLALGEGEIQVFALDGLEFTSPVRALKIDVEGMELDVLEGGRQLIERDRPLLYVECATEVQYRPIAKLLEQWNYTYWETFNATPTHLFIPVECITAEQQFQHLQAKVAQNDYRSHLQLRETRTALNESNLKYRAVSEQVATLRQKLGHEEAARQHAADRVATLEAELTTLDSANASKWQAREAQMQTLASDLKARTESAHAADKAALQAKAQLETVHQQLDTANTKYRESTQRYAELKERLGQAEAKHQSVALRCAELQAMLEVTQTALNAERQERQQQVATLGLELRERTEATHDAQKQLIRAEVTLDGVRAQLDAEHQKYLNIGERYADLKGRLAALEASRLETLKSLTGLQAQYDATVRALQTVSAEQADDRAAHSVEVEALRQQVRERTEDLQEAQKQLVRTEGVIGALTAQLEAVNFKYGEVTASHDALRQQHAQAKVAHQRRVDELLQAVEIESSAAQVAQAQLSRAVLDLQALEADRDERVRVLAADIERHTAQLLAADRVQEANASVVASLRSELAELQAEIETGAVLLLQARHAQANSASRVDVLQAELSAVRAQADLVQQEQTAQLRQMAASQQAVHDELEAVHAQSAQTLKAHTLEVQALLTLDETRRGELNALQHKHDAVLDKLAVLGNAHTEVQAQMHLAQGARQAADSRIEQHKLDLLKGRQAVMRAEREIERLRHQKQLAEDQVARTRAMLSFQVGYAVVHGLKSPITALKLPKTLWDIYRQHQSRKRLKAAPFDVPQNASGMPAVGGPVLRAEQRDALTLNPALATIENVQRLKLLRVACIMDEFTFSSYQPECNLFQLTPTLYSQELEGFQPELLFIESAWRGKDDLWGNKVGHLSQEVHAILAWCREHKVPTVFWNKEDPIHFETFLNTARLFDHVFTTDIDCIHRYKAALAHDRVYLLPFAAQPHLSNPIEKYSRKDAFCFAGAYYVRYPERTRDLGNFVTQLADYRPVEIYDRNFGKDDSNYQFPAEYQPFIVGNLPFEQIDKAYKGYRYAINLNSIKQSQSMFARRIYELLASNTITVSNFSRGVRLLFGDLVFTADDGAEIVRRLRGLCADEVRERKFRLAALRKVMSQHTYQDRLAYLVGKVQGNPIGGLLPAVAVTAYAKNKTQCEGIFASFQRQTYESRRLYLVVPRGFEPDGVSGDNRITILPVDSIVDQTVGEAIDGALLVAAMVPDDYYGPNYLTDLALASRYSQASGYGKGAHHVWSAGGGLKRVHAEQAYCATDSLSARSSLLRTELVADQNLRTWVTGLYTYAVHAENLLCVDEFNYCKNGAAAGFDANAVDDLQGLDLGIDLDDVVARAERIAPEEAAPDQAPVWHGEQLAAYFKPAAGRGYTCTVSGPGWEIESQLADGKHDYLYAGTDLRPIDLGWSDAARFYLDVTLGLNVQLVILFLDAQKQRISHIVKPANRNQEAVFPVGTEWIRLGIRVYGSGSARINSLVLGHRPMRPAEVIGRSDHLVLTNHYPSYDDLYRNAFVHSRVMAYAQQGVGVDVFRLRHGDGLSYHEFNDVDVMTGSQEALQKLLIGHDYKNVLVHFLDETMWEVLKHHQDRLQIRVWVHGADIQPWHRRAFNFETEEQLQRAQEQSEARMRFWRGLLRDMPTGLKLVFVSRFFADQVMEDLGFSLPQDRYEIIHNPIDTDLFIYQEKPIAQRKKILSIRPYASRTYANDLSVQAIIALSRKPWFKELEFRMIGDGKLFDETLAPLKDFNNVIIERGFLTQAEIAKLHQSYGVFLCPSRMDTQGVSRDEAMSSGLVPVTNAVGAISEFVDEACGFAVDAEDYGGLARSIELMVENPELFGRLSASAAARVRNQSAKSMMVKAEINLMRVIS